MNHRGRLATRAGQENRGPRRTGDIGTGILGRLTLWPDEKRDYPHSRAFSFREASFHALGWLRAAVLGADDGLVSTAALLVGVAASGASKNAILTAGIAALSAGAMAMAIGEYVSVSAQADTEAADRNREEQELASNPKAELQELSPSTVTAALSRAGRRSWHRPAGARPAHGSSARRARSHRHVQSPTDSGRSGVRSQLRNGCGHPTCHRLVQPERVAQHRHRRRHTGGPVRARCSRSGHGRCTATTRGTPIGIGGALALAVTYGVGALFGSAA